MSFEIGDLVVLKSGYALFEDLHGEVINLEGYRVVVKWHNKKMGYTFTNHEIAEGLVLDVCEIPL